MCVCVCVCNACMCAIDNMEVEVFRHSKGKQVGNYLNTLVAIFGIVILKLA